MLSGLPIGGDKFRTTFLPFPTNIIVIQLAVEGTSNRAEFVAILELLFAETPFLLQTIHPTDLPVPKGSQPRANLLSANWMMHQQSCCNIQSLGSNALLLVRRWGIHRNAASFSGPSSRVPQPPIALLRERISGLELTEIQNRFVQTERIADITLQIVTSTKGKTDSTVIRDYLGNSSREVTSRNLTDYMIVHQLRLFSRAIQYLPIPAFFLVSAADS
jgi:hypothetical protein